MDSNTSKRKWPVIRTIFVSGILILVTAGILLYNNFNQILSKALIKNFNSSIVSDVYELQFEKLRVNVFEGSIRLFNASLLPREKPLRSYPYINSSFRFKAEKLTLENVAIRNLLKSNILNLERITITSPEVELILKGDNNIMLPFNDSIAVKSENKVNNKKSLNSFMLKEFQLIDASFHVKNAGKQRELTIENFNISLYNLLVDQHPGEYLTSFKKVTLSVGKLEGHLQKGSIKHIGFKDFKIGIDSLAIQYTLDTLMYHFRDFNAGLHNLEIQTADSIFHLAIQSFDLSHHDQSIKLKKISFKPNVSQSVLQKNYQYQHADFSGSVGTLDLNHVNFDSILYAQKIFIDEVVLDSVQASIFKDKTKPIDKNRKPVYEGQIVRGIPLPVLIKHVKATHVHLDNTERKPDSTYAKLNITRGTLDVKNITNLAPLTSLIVHADAYLNGKAHFKVGLAFEYQKPQFSFEGVVEKFSLPDLNPLIQAYAPAKINTGIADEISFSGIASETKANGTMKFLYHDLEIDLELKEQAKWKSSFLAFTANSVMNSSNPVSATLPPRNVQFHIERDMNKGFLNVIIKSIMNGLKETMIMSKENRKAYKESKRNSKK